MIVDRALVAEALPGYELGQELGRGASGLVVAARHRRLGREVAVKILAAGSESKGQLEQRFLAEAQVLSELDHPHIVRLHDYVEHRGLCLLVMERLSGGSLRARVLARAPVEYACGFGLAVSDALHAAHQRHILHRDIKPDNLLFAGDGTVKVADFGIAKLFEGSDAAASSFIGSPTYMAPEQASLGRLGPGTDLYSLSVVLYQLFTGHSLFPRELPPAAMLLQHLKRPPPPMPDVPGEVAAVVMRALAKDIAERQPTARAFAFDLATAAAHELGPGWLSRARLPLRIDDQLRDAARSLGSPSQVTEKRPAPAPPSREPPTVDVLRPSLPQAASSPPPPPGPPGPRPARPPAASSPASPGPAAPASVRPPAESSPASPEHARLREERPPTPRVDRASVPPESAKPRPDETAADDFPTVPADGSTVRPGAMRLPGEAEPHPPQPAGSARQLDPPAGRARPTDAAAGRVRPAEESARRARPIARPTGQARATEAPAERARATDQGAGRGRAADVPVVRARRPEEAPVQSEERPTDPLVGRVVPGQRKDPRAQREPPPDERPTVPLVVPGQRKAREKEPALAGPVVVPATPAWLRNPPPRKKIRRWLGRRRLLVVGIVALAIAAGGFVAWMSTH